MGNSLPDFAPADNPAASEPVFVTRLLTFLYLPVYNLWLLIFPANLSYDYSLYTIPLVDELASVENVLSFVLYTSLFITIVLYLRYISHFTGEQEKNEEYLKKITSNDSKNVRNNNSTTMLIASDHTFLCETLNLIVLGLTLLILPFLPATNLFFYVGFIVAERILYIPSIGFCLLMVTSVRLLLKYYGDKSEKIRNVLMVLLVLFASKTYHRNFSWKNEEALYRWAFLLLKPGVHWTFNCYRGIILTVFLFSKK